MKRVLWICNAVFTNDSIKATGSWLQPLAEALVETGLVEVANISFSPNGSYSEAQFGRIPQYLLSRQTAMKYGQEATDKTCHEILHVVEDYGPDLIHIWGTESVWASVIRKQVLPQSIPVLIDIQGLLEPYADFMYGGLTLNELLKCISIRELLMPTNSLFYRKYLFHKRGKEEHRNLQAFKYISTQSKWVKDVLHFVVPQASFFDTKIMLRSDFYECDQWKYHNPESAPIVFTSSSGANSYKGLHMVLRMIALLKNDYPYIKLRIAGDFKSIRFKMMDGYCRYLQELIKKLGLMSNVIFLGSLTSKGIIDELHSANVCIIPSFAETYCLGFAESMIVGCPTVCAFSGAMPELAIDGKEALFYNAPDYREGASRIREILCSETLSNRLSTEGRKRRLSENSPSAVLSKQLSIYNSIFSESE